MPIRISIFDRVLAPRRVHPVGQLPFVVNSVEVGIQTKSKKRGAAHIAAAVVIDVSTDKHNATIGELNRRVESAVGGECRSRGNGAGEQIENVYSGATK